MQRLGLSCKSSLPHPLPHPQSSAILTSKYSRAISTSFRRPLPFSRLSVASSPNQCPSRDFPTSPVLLGAVSCPPSHAQPGAPPSDTWPRPPRHTCVLGPPIRHAWPRAPPSHTWPRGPLTLTAERGNRSLNAGLLKGRSVSSPPPANTTGDAGVRVLPWVELQDPGTQEHLDDECSPHQQLSPECAYIPLRNLAVNRSLIPFQEEECGADRNSRSALPVVRVVPSPVGCIFCAWLCAHSTNVEVISGFASCSLSSWSLPEGSSRISAAVLLNQLCGPCLMARSLIKAFELTHWITGTRQVASHPRQLRWFQAASLYVGPSRWPNTGGTLLLRVCLGVEVWVQKQLKESVIGRIHKDSQGERGGQCVHSVCESHRLC